MFVANCYILGPLVYYTTYKPSACGSLCILTVLCYCLVISLMWRNHSNNEISEYLPTSCRIWCHWKSRFNVITVNLCTLQINMTKGKCLMCHGCFCMIRYPLIWAKQTLAWNITAGVVIAHWHVIVINTQMLHLSFQCRIYNWTCPNPALSTYCRCIH